MSKPIIRKIYTDDPLVKYTSTEIPPDRTKHEIDGVLAEYEVKDVYWHWDPDHNSVYVMFKIEEIFNGTPILSSVRVDAPTLWDRAKPRAHPPRPEQINWKVSMRAMHHFIYTHLNASYAMSSSKTVAFLGYIRNSEGKQLKDLIIPRLQNMLELKNKEEPEWEPPSQESKQFTVPRNENVRCEDCTTENCDIRGSSKPMPCMDFTNKVP